MTSVYQAWTHIRPDGEILSWADRLDRLKRKLWADKIWLKSAEAHFMVCGEWDKAELEDSRRHLKRMQARVVRLEHLIKIVQERVDKETMDNMLCPVCLNDGSRPQCLRCGRVG